MKTYNDKQSLVFAPSPGIETFVLGAAFRRLGLPKSCIHVQTDGTVQVRIPAKRVGEMLIDLDKEQCHE